MTKAREFRSRLELANETEYGLTGAVYSKNPEKIRKARDEFFVGNLYINRKCTGAMVGAHPFGGFNMSGTDSKAGGPDYLLQFLQPEIHRREDLTRRRKKAVCGAGGSACRSSSKPHREKYEQRSVRPPPHRLDRRRHRAVHASARVEALRQGGRRRAGDHRVVTVTDDGGSSGRLRRDFDVLPPGDIRNCMVALSEDEALAGEACSNTASPAAAA